MVSGLAHQRAVVALRIGALRDADAAEILPRRAGAVHVVAGDQREAGVRAAGAIRIHRILGKSGKRRQRLAKTVDVVGIGGQHKRRNPHHPPAPPEPLGAAPRHRWRRPSEHDPASAATGPDVASGQRRYPGARVKLETDSPSIVRGLQPRSLRQRMQRPADPPMRAVHRISPIGHADRGADRNAVIAAPLHRRPPFQRRACRARWRPATPPDSAVRRAGFSASRSAAVPSRTRRSLGPCSRPAVPRTTQRSRSPALASRFARAERCRRTLPRRAPASAIGATATAATAGCWRSALSTSTAAMFSPERRMTFLRRSTKCNDPSGPRRTTSPVWNQPSCPGFGGRIRIFQILTEETKTRIGPGVAHQQFALVGSVRPR